MLSELGPKFNKMAAEIFTKSIIPSFVPNVLAQTVAVDEMAARLDEVEAQVKAGNDEIRANEGN